MGSHGWLTPGSVFSVLAHTDTGEGTRAYWEKQSGPKHTGIWSDNMPPLSLPTSVADMTNGSQHSFSRISGSGGPQPVDPKQHLTRSLYICPCDLLSNTPIWQARKLGGQTALAVPIPRQVRAEAGTGSLLSRFGAVLLPPRASGDRPLMLCHQPILWMS